MESCRKIRGKKRKTTKKGKSIGKYEKQEIMIKRLNCFSTVTVVNLPSDVKDEKKTNGNIQVILFFFIIFQFVGETGIRKILEKRTKKIVAMKNNNN